MDFIQLIGRCPNDPARVDNTDNADALVTIDTNHNRIHRGHSFVHAKEHATVTTGQAADTLLIVTKPCHVRIRGATEGSKARLSLFEGPTFSSNGTQQTPRNRNRLSSKVPTTEVYDNPVLTGTGTVLFQKMVPPNGEMSDPEEWVLAPGNYILEVRNLDAATQRLYTFVDFYEELN